MTVDHLGSSALSYGLYITIFIALVVSFGLAISFAARKVAVALKRTHSHGMRRAVVATPPPLSGARPGPITEGRC